MLLNKHAIFLALVFAFMFFSCSGKKSNQENDQAVDYENPQVVLQKAKEILGPFVSFAYKGRFDMDTVLEIAAGTETQTPKEWGIKFVLLKMVGDQLKVVFQTPLLNGSFKQCLVQKIKFPFFDHELIYYNSQDYFLGSGGGEVYSYLVNFNEKETYYAHLVTQPDKPISLYLSDNINIPQVKGFFISNFKRDYPSLKVISKDVALKY